MVVLAIDDRVPRLALTTRDFPCGNKPRVDRVSELRDDDQVVQRNGLRFRLFRGG